MVDQFLQSHALSAFTETYLDRNLDFAKIPATLQEQSAETLAMRKALGRIPVGRLKQSFALG